MSEADTCSTPDCERVRNSKGMCIMHYSRSRKGAVGGAAPLRRAPGTGSINGDGYLVLGNQRHPLATAQGKLLMHRAVLYDQIGPGAHECRWCGKTLTWRGDAESRVNADHLDHNKLNNEPSNLVPSCLDCNTKRSPKPRRVAKPPQPRVYTERELESARQRARAYYAANRVQVLARMKAKRASSEENAA